MKQLMTGLLPLLAMLAACKDQQAVANPPELSGERAASVAAAQIVPANPAPPKTVKVSDELVEFEYAYPAAAAAIPALKTLLDGDLAAKRAGLVADARQAKADAQANDYPFRPYGLGYDWQVVAELPNWLSLSSTVYSDTGGAHPNHWFDALLWDKAADAKRGVEDLFVSRKALSNALRRPFCAALDKQRAQKRGEPVDPASGSEFDQCMDPAEQTVILGSSNKQAFDRIGILVAPYAAGPYVEGSYEVTLPVTAAVMEAVKPGYRSSFAIAR